MLKNGKSKDHASEELHVFLGDDTAVFISWLWGHLSSNMHLYVQPQERTREVKDDEAPKEVSGREKSSDVLPRSKHQTHSGHTIESSEATSRRRSNREWKGIGRKGNEKFPLRNVLTDILHGEDKRSQKSNEVRPPPSKQQNDRKRERDDETHQTKKDSSSRSMLGDGASRRLLQFAVRDAVKAVQPTSTSAEPASKRLCSVVATTSTEHMRDRRSERSQDYLNDRRSERSQDNLSDRRSERTRPMLQVHGAALALRAAAEAAADSAKVRSTGSVFKRLGQGNVVKQPSRSREEKRDYEDFEPVTIADEHDSDQYVNNEESEEESGELTMADRVAGSGMYVDSSSEDDMDRDEGITRYQTSLSHDDTFSPFAEKKTVSAPCSVELETNAIRPSSVNDEEQPVPSTPTASKAVAISVDVNMVEPPSYATPKDVHVVEKPYVAPMNSNAASIATNAKELGHAEVQKDSQRSAPSVPVSYSTAHPMEDADSRTLYVNNVHFAATKDSLSRHFNKFGAVLKVVIVTNAATGQPTGSAYVEFLHKESAERALSLNGTSFMTRILKVVRRSSHEAAHFYGWPGSGRSSIYGRHGRMAYPRAVIPGGSFRGRAPMKAGARSLQWKREPSGTDSSAGAKTDMSVAFSSEQVLPRAT
ncbi:nucleolin isoform X2 [Zea mays]|nr:nucleolin isoform X2 [Zea mays]XP_020408402.1 nucleolin isoform X2 [Zea mays]XP_035823396.1 nucleolin isoform X2 [Zea mays]XP_035823397.1 nucleolin isoform X2 [Zea mays]AQK58288.1 RNA binding (RRM/RBD/RNP motifs) family protein [Zea mays]AQK58295.1 RNA binding (RRM/RBD/RNP motifs) family protein [Zea mays]|eukprot:XP_020408401.1 nucleolin isoform X2 [Zea mays]